MDILLTNIKRYWCRSYNGILDNDGYFHIPNDKYSLLGNDIPKIEDVNNNACVFLTNSIGEASNQFMELYHYEQVRSVKDTCLYFDLSEYNSEIRIINDVFSNHNIHTWIEQSNNLYLFIEGFDVCKYRMPSLSKILISEIKKIDKIKDRLYLRFISSSGLWDIDLEKFFNEFWGEDNSIRLSITPLQKDDVITVCKLLNIADNKFIQSIKEYELEPLVINPTSFKYLLKADISKLFTKEMSVAELFYNGCLSICREGIRNCDNNIVVSPQKMIAISSRVAAIMVFCRKEYISDNDQFGNCVLLVSEIFEEIETTGEYDFCITYNDILLTIKLSGLFFIDDEGKFSFYHKSIQEYLAAVFINNHEFDKDKIVSLFTNSKDQEGKLYEWVSGTFGWLQKITPKIDVLEYFAYHDPLKILYGEVVPDDEFRKRLVSLILDKFNSAEILDDDWNLIRNSGGKLYHSDIATQLKPYIENKTLHILARRNAFSIVESCNLTSLQDDVWRIVDDKSENLEVRESAMHCLSNIADSEDLFENIKYLYTNSTADDKNDELKGYAVNTLLKAKRIDTKTILENLTPPQKRSFFGMYRMFITYVLPNELDIDGAEQTLIWIKNNTDELRSNLSVFQQLFYQVIWKCWRNYDELQNQNLFVETIIILFTRHLPIFPQVELTFEEKSAFSSNQISQRTRFDVANEILKSTNAEQLFYFDFLSTQLILQNEFENVVSYYKLGNDVSDLWKNVMMHFNSYDLERKALIRKEFPSEIDTTFKDLLYGKSREDMVIEQQIKEKARELKKEEELEIAMEKVRSELSNCISAYKDRKDGNSWINFFRLLSYRFSNGRYFEEILSSDVTNYKNWSLVSPEDYKTIVDVSKDFIETYDDDHDSWFGKDLYSYKASAGFKSLMLILSLKGDDALNDITENILERWIYVIINYSENSESKENKHRKELLISKLLKTVPVSATRVIREKILIENNNNISYLFVLRYFELYFDDHSENMLFEVLDTEDLSSKAKQQIIALLLKKRPTKTAQYIINELNKNYDQEYKQYLIAALLNDLNDFEQEHNHWDNIVSNISDDSEFEKQCYLSFVGTNTFHPICNKLNEVHLSYLFERLYILFPPKDDPKFDGVHCVGERESIGYLRDNLLRTLTNKGTPLAVNELERLQKIFPHANIEFSVVRAKDVVRNTDYDNISATNFQRLSRNGKFRIISNGNELLKLIEESLIRLTQILQGSQPMSYTLWDVGKTKKTTSPKNEEHLSNYVAQHLRQDLQRYAITPYREVELRCKRITEDAKRGENVDIMIDYCYKDQKINVIIEVKGSWNSECPSNMKVQLLDRYMKTHKCDYGMYLIGWYNNNNPNVKNRTACSSIENAVKHYNDMAIDISNTEKVSLKSFILDCRLN